MRIRRVGCLLAVVWLALSFSAASAADPVVNVIYVNGIMNTLAMAKATQVKIQARLDSSPNHPLGVSRRLYIVDLVWNPVGFYGTARDPGLDELKEDKIELFLLKTAEEQYSEQFKKILALHNQSSDVDQAAARLVVATGLGNGMLPGNTSLEAKQEVNADRMLASLRTVRSLVSKIKSLGSSVVIAHSQGNLLANLAWAQIASERGTDARRWMKLVNVANTSLFSVHGLNLTHERDAALFSDAVKSLAANPICKGAGVFPVLTTDSSLEMLPSETGWTRTTSDCPNAGTCPFRIAPYTFAKASGEINYPGAFSATFNPDACLDHSIVATYLTDDDDDTVAVKVPLRDGNSQGVVFTPGQENFADRFEDLVYAAAGALDPVVSSFDCPATVTVGLGVMCTATGENLPDGMKLSGGDCTTLGEVSGGNFASRSLICMPASAGLITVTLAGPGGTPTLGSAQVSVSPAPPTVQTVVDLIVEAVSFSPTSVPAGGAIKVTFTVKNRGSAIADASVAAVRITQSSTLPPVGLDTVTARVPSLLPGSSATVSMLTAPVPATAGTYQVWVTADVTGQSGQNGVERADDSTAAPGALTVTSPPSPPPPPPAPILPDLAVQNPVFSPTSTAPGATVQVSFTIANIGTAAAAVSAGAVRLSQSPTSAGITNDASFAISAISAGSTWNGNASLVAPAAAGTYYIWVLSDIGNSSGQSSSALANDVARATGTLTVAAAATVPVITAPPQSTTVDEWFFATFAVTATGTPPYSYQWRRNGVAIPGATEARYNTPVVTVADSGAVFSVVISNSAGSVQSAGATLTVKPASLPSGVFGVANETIVRVGQVAMFSAELQPGAELSWGPFTYQWHRNGQPVPGATGRIYSTAATTAQDDGALFSVVVTGKSGGTRSSGPARLTVSSFGGGAGRYLVAVGGAAVSAETGVSLADTVLPIKQGALVAVHESGTSPWVVVEPAGQWSPLSGDSWGLPLFMLGLNEATINPVTRVASGIRPRYSLYLKGDRIFALDHIAGATGPVSRALSSQTTSEICRSNVFYTVPDYVDASRSQLLYRVAGTDGRCGSADDQQRAVRLSSGPSDAPVTPPGSVLSPLYDSVGALSGFLVRQGNQLLRTDAAFGSTVAIAAPDLTGAVVHITGFGFAAPGNLIYSQAGELKALDLDNPTTPVALVSLPPGESWVYDGSATVIAGLADGNSLYLASTATNSTTRIWRIDRTLVAQEVTSTQGTAFSFIGQNASRLVFSAGGRSYSVAKTGGQPQQILSTVSVNSFVAGDDLVVWHPGVGVTRVRLDGSQLDVGAGSGSWFMYSIPNAEAPFVPSFAAWGKLVGEFAGYLAVVDGTRLIAYQATTRTVLGEFAAPGLTDWGGTNWLLDYSRGGPAVPNYAPMGSPGIVAYSDLRTLPTLANLFVVNPRAGTGVPVKPASIRNPSVRTKAR